MGILGGVLVLYTFDWGHKAFRNIQRSPPMSREHSLVRVSQKAAEGPCTPLVLCIPVQGPPRPQTGLEHFKEPGSPTFQVKIRDSL